MPDTLIVTSFLTLLQGFAPCFSRPSFETFLVLAGGWVLNLGRHTVTGTIRAANAVGWKHFSSFHRVLRSGQLADRRSGRHGCSPGGALDFQGRGGARGGGRYAGPAHRKEHRWGVDASRPTAVHGQAALLPLGPPLGCRWDHDPRVRQVVVSASSVQALSRQEALCGGEAAPIARRPSWRPRSLDCSRRCCLTDGSSWLPTPPTRTVRSSSAVHRT